MVDQIPPLPVKDGISPNRLWLPKGEWKTVFDFFMERFPHLTYSDCLSRFSRGEVRFSDGTIIGETSSYQPEHHIYFYRELSSELKVPFKERIIYQDENIVVADKPHFLPVAPTGQYLHETLLTRLRKRLKLNQLELCHRLDRETAGVVMLTKRPEIRHLYHELFSQRNILKSYQALARDSEIEFPVTKKSRLVEGEPYFRMQEVDGKANTETHIELLKQSEDHCLYQLAPVTGKKHQLRVHMAALGCPILNDPLYPVLTDKKSDDFSSPLKLLAKSLRFIDPVSQKVLLFESERSL